MPIARHLLQHSGAFDPSSISGLQAWFKADGTLWTTSARSTPATADGDLVGAWDDATTNARHALQATGANRPTLKTNQLNGKPCVRLSRTTQTFLATTTGFLTAAPITIVALIKNTTFDGNENWVGSASGSNATLATTVAGKITVYAGSSLTGATAMSTTNAQVVVGYFNGASSKGYLGGGAADVSGNAGSLKYNGLAFGVYNPASVSVDMVTGDYFEVLAYSAALSLSDLNAIGAYLAAKWGVSWTTAT